jgi:hypothetical protein
MTLIRSDPRPICLFPSVRQGSRHNDSPPLPPHSWPALWRPVRTGLQDPRRPAQVHKPELVNRNCTVQRGCKRTSAVYTVHSLNIPKAVLLMIIAPCISRAIYTTFSVTLPRSLALLTVEHNEAFVLLHSSVDYPIA